MGKIGIFGGSFNPPHIGHILAAKEMIQSLQLDRLYFVPAAVPPHKTLAPDSPNKEARLALVQLAICDQANMSVSDIELQRGGTSYTADTVEQIHDLHPEDQLFLLVGNDMFLSLHEWYQPEKIAKFCTIVLMQRQTPTAQQSLQLQEQTKRLEQTFQAHIMCVENRHIDLSSTRVRRMLAFGCGEDYLDPQVYREIMKHHYYAAGKSQKGLPFEQLKEKVVQLLKPSRVAHVLGCCQTAVRLAKKWGANETDAARAGILHDITKALTPDEQLKLCQKYDIVISNFESENPKLLHAKTGAAVARYIFGENDAVYNAICWHTTGKAAMSMLEKIIYLADYMEPNRDFDGVEVLRQQVASDIDLALYTALELSVRVLEEKGSCIDKNSMAARNYMKQQQENKNRL